MTKKKAIVSWSTGKDGAYAYHKATQSGEFEIVGLLTTITETFERVSMHGTREALLDEQARKLGQPILKVQIPWPCTNEIYEEQMGKAVEQIKAQGVTHIIFGDLYLEDIRDYRLEKMKDTGLECVFPLWGLNTTKLADEMVASGLRSILVCVDPKAIDASFAGRVFDETLLQDLPDKIDPCGENGEFHTAVIAGPMFDSPIDVTVGEIVERSGFIYADVSLTSDEKSVG